MAVQETVKRHFIIINSLRNKPLSFDEINFKLENEESIDGNKLTCSQRTFQREIQAILSIYGIEIVCDRHTNKYFIKDLSENNAQTNRMLEALDLMNVLDRKKSISDYIFFESRKSTGSIYIMDILTAIKRRECIRFIHRKFWDEEPTIREVEPYAVREYKYRWYLMAKDYKDNKVKYFGLDRVEELTITGKKFNFPKNFNPENYGENSYGVIVDDSDVHKIVLSFTKFQGKYIKTLPLHHSQKIISDNAGELKIELKLQITHDIKMDLLSYGNQVKVLEPKSLADEIKEMHEEAMELY